MTIKIAIVGVGNCASSLVQCIYADKANSLGPGLSHPVIGQYRVSDIEVVAAFDVDSRKINLPLTSAIFAEPNCTTKRAIVPSGLVIVSRGALLDGVCEEMRSVVKVDPVCHDVQLSEVVDVMRRANVELVVSYLPVGSQKASEFYAEAAVSAGAGFINCTPARVAHSEQIARAFESAGLVLLGDDVKSQFGSTAIHRALVHLLQSKGLHITSTYQLNIGGNTDFQNMRSGDRGKQKKYTKENSIRTLLQSEETALSVGPSDYVPSLSDFKVGYFRIEGLGVLDMPFKLDMKIEVEDSPNSAGVVVNAIRAAKLASDRGICGRVNSVCPYLFKDPPIVTAETESLQCFDRFIAGSNNA